MCSDLSCSHKEDGSHLQLPLYLPKQSVPELQGPHMSHEDSNVSIAGKHKLGKPFPTSITNSSSPLTIKINVDALALGEFISVAVWRFLVRGGD